MRFPSPRSGKVTSKLVYRVLIQSNAFPFTQIWRGDKQAGLLSVYKAMRFPSLRSGEGWLGQTFGLCLYVLRLKNVHVLYCFQLLQDSI